MDLTQYTESQLSDLQTSISYELQRRKAAPHVYAAETALIENLRSTGAIEPPAATQDPSEDAPEWQDPGTDHSKMYTAGDCVSYNGKIWRSEHPGLNHWVPGTEGVDYRIWREIRTIETVPVDPESPQVPQWVPGTVYAVGDEILFEGAVYRVLQGHTSAAHWPPNAVASLYTLA